MEKVSSKCCRRSESASPKMVLTVLVGILWSGNVETKLVKEGGRHAIEQEDRAIEVANDDQIAVRRRRSDCRDGTRLVRYLRGIRGPYLKEWK